MYIVGAISIIVFIAVVSLLSYRKGRTDVLVEVINVITRASEKTKEMVKDSCDDGNCIVDPNPTLTIDMIIDVENKDNNVSLFRLGSDTDLEGVNRFEVIDSTGRAYVKYDIKELKLSSQDDGHTLKVFIKQ